ncbi:MAG TPA: ABC transporter ATP-binding protein [Bryobacteraceae bacterium]
MNPILEFDHVTRAYKKGVPVLDGVSFALAEGEVAGLVGRNGAGKSTLLRIAMGMLVPQQGRVRVFGLSPIDDPVEVKKRIGYVAEDQVLPAGMSIAELAALHRALFPKWDGAMEKDLCDRFGLSPRDRIKQLSKGQKREVALMLALCHRPELLILDEPAGGLDPAARREFLEASIRLLNREGSAILFSSHHMGDIERIGARVLLLDEGKIRLDCELDRVREDLCVAMVPKAWIEAAALEKTPGCLRVRPVFDDWHAVFQGAPETVTAQLRGPLGSRGVSCIRVPLEELFVELVGGKPAGENA